MWVLFAIWVLGMMLLIGGLIVLSFIVKSICLLIDYKNQPYHFSDFICYYHYDDEDTGIAAAVTDKGEKVIWVEPSPRLKRTFLNRKNKNENSEEKEVE